MFIPPTLAAFLTSFLTVGLKGFQSKNVIGHHVKSVAVTSFCVAMCEVMLVGLVATNGWSVAIPSGLGASLGMVTSILLHDKFLGKSG